MEGKVVVDKNFYWKLFKSTFIISAFTIGGGFVIISLLKAKFVDEYKWLDDKEALNLVAIAQSAPGIMAVNASIIKSPRCCYTPKGTVSIAFVQFSP